MQLIGSARWVPCACPGTPLVTPWRSPSRAGMRAPCCARILAPPSTPPRLCRKIPLADLAQADLGNHLRNLGAAARRGWGRPSSDVKHVQVRYCQITCNRPRGRPRKMPSVCSQRTADNKFEFGLQPTPAIVSNVGVAAQSPGMLMEITYARNLTTLQITY